MHLCLHTDSVADLTLEQALDFAGDTGISSVEIAAGGQSRAPHMRVFELLEDANKRVAYADAISSRGLKLDAINCSAWPMHPIYGGAHLELMGAAIRLAGELGVETIVTMSGCPGDSPQARTLNWIAFPWPDESHSILDEQWEIAVETWRELAILARASGVKRIALELIPLHLVYNVPTLLRMRKEVGPIIGANIDPSHMFWQQMDPVEVIAALEGAVHHVHLKDLAVNERELSLAGVLDPRPVDNPAQRTWVFRTIGQGHPASFWRAFLDALEAIGYKHALSIENEDPLLPGNAGVLEAVSFINGLGDLESTPTSKADRV